MEEIIDFYYNPNVPCTCEAIFADTHRAYCKRRNKKSAEEWLKQKVRKTQTEVHNR